MSRMYEAPVLLMMHGDDFRYGCVSFDCCLLRIYFFEKLHHLN